MLQVFVGYDPREAVAYHVCCNSIIRHCATPVCFTPLALNTLGSFYSEKHKDGSNQFVYSRFLIPYLCGFNGVALYIDGDMIVNGNIAEIFRMNDFTKDVMVVKHDYLTKFPVKYFGAENRQYPRKNWSSVILWNCANYPNRVLTPEFVSSKTGSYLHQFQWLSNDRIGELPKEWNHLVGEYDTNKEAKLLHYTKSIPAIEDCGDNEHAKDWWDELRLVNHAAQ